MMKKILCTLALTLMAFMTHAQMLPETGASRIAAASTKTGDVNGDYKVNVDDVVMIIQYLVEQAGNNFIVSNADVNCDGVITNSDAVATAMLILEGDKPQSYLSCPDGNHPHMIDLGLPSGTKWACCNVGADKPEAYGGYYAWGETEEKSLYLQNSYNYYQNENYVDIGSDIAGTQNDVAHVKWGGDWRMPNRTQASELIQYCKYQWTTTNGVRGVTFTGTNGGYVFLPLAGSRYNSVLNSSGSVGAYWLSSQYPSILGDAYYLCLGNSVYLNGYGNSSGRYYGHSVRPVYDENAAQPLALSMSSVEIEVGESATVEITSGNGSYTVGSSRTNVATASLSGTTITILGAAVGLAVVTVKDTTTGNSLTISVTVTKSQGYPTCPDSNHPHMIDLGLPSGTLWACCNVGANKPEAYGGYYAWGETEEKSLYLLNSYKYYQNENYVDIGSDIAGTQNDVAHVKWGGDWRMPNRTQASELIQYCKYQWTTTNGVQGVTFTGTNGGNVFLPLAGSRYNSVLNSGGSVGAYWLSSLYPSILADAYYLCLGNSVYLNGYGNSSGRYYGHSVRPVYVENAPQPLALSMSSVEIKVGESATVEITSGNGSYTVSSFAPSVATASLSGTTITIMGVAAGSAVVTVTDTTTGNSLTISVTVTAAKPQSYLACPDSNHPHMIDLGLPSGTLWACCNVGADKPEAYGGYYAWGETEEKDYYDWSTYIHCDGSYDTCHDIGSDIAGTQYDVAHVKWGGSWRMPSHDQNKDLLDKCTYEWTTLNGVNGEKFTSKKNGGTIFLPAAGYCFHDNLSAGGMQGYYWLSTQYPSRSYYAYYLLFFSGNVYQHLGDRSNGQSVRPVVRN